MNRGFEHCSNKMSDRMPNTRPVKMSNDMQALKKTN